MFTFARFISFAGTDGVAPPPPLGGVQVAEPCFGRSTGIGSVLAWGAFGDRPARGMTRLWARGYLFATPLITVRARKGRLKRFENLLFLHRLDDWGATGASINARNRIDTTMGGFHHYSWIHHSLASSLQNHAAAAN